MRRATVTRYSWLVARDANMNPAEFEKTSGFRGTRCMWQLRKKASTCRSKGAKGEWIEKVYGFVIACNSLKGKSRRWRWNELEKAAKSYKAKTGVGIDGFHPKVPLDLTEETTGEVVEFLDNVEQSGKWPQQARTTMFFLLPKNVTSERPIALMPTLIRRWEAMRAPEVAK